VCQQKPPRSPLVSRLLPVAAILFLGCSLLRPREQIISSSIRDLREGTYAEREIAVLRLVKVGEPAVPAIIQVLGEKDDDARYFAVRALGRMGDRGREAIPVLLDMLRDDEMTIPSSTAEAVAGMGEVAIPPLLDAAGDPDDGLRYWAAYALGRTRAHGSGVESALVGMLDDPHPAIRSQVAASLERIGPNAVPVLIAALDSAPPGAVPEITAVLKSIGGAPALEAVRRAESRSLSSATPSPAGDVEELGPDAEQAGFGAPVVSASEPPPEEPTQPGAVASAEAPASTPAPVAGAEAKPVAEPIQAQSGEGVQPQGENGILLDLAVVDLSTWEKSAGDATVATDWLRSELVSTRQLTIVEKREMERVIAERDFQWTGGTKEDCAVRLGRLLNVRWMVIGSYGKDPNGFVMRVRVVEVETGRIVYGATAKGKNEKEIGAAVRHLASRISFTLGK